MQLQAPPFTHLYRELDREAEELSRRRRLLGGLPASLSRVPSSVHAKGHRANGQIRFKVPSRQAALDLMAELPPQHVYLFIEAHGAPTIGPLCSFKTPPADCTRIADFIFRVRHARDAAADSCVQWWTELGGQSVQVLAELPEADILVERLPDAAGGWAVHGVPSGELVQWGKQSRSCVNPLTVHWPSRELALANLGSRTTVHVGSIA